MLRSEFSALTGFIEAIATSVAIFNVEGQKIGQILSCNHEFCTMLGMRKDDVLGRPLREFIPRYARKNIESRLSDSIKLSNTQEFIQPFDVGGKTRWWRIVVHPVLDNDKNVESIFMTCIDVSEQVELENNLVISNSRFSSVIQSAYDGIVSIDRNQLIKIFNSSAEEMFGYDAEEVVGKHISILIPREFHERHDGHFHQFNSSPIRSRQMFERGGRITGITKDGSEFPVEISIAKIEVDGETEYTAVVRDISERARLIDQLHQQATFDELTGLINRRAFFERADEHITLAHRNNSPLSLLMIDIDRFKLVNDQYGHAAGDMVLKAIAVGGASIIRKSDFFARLGGEEFAILLPQTDQDEATCLAERFRDKIANTTLDFDWNGQTPVKPTVSIGIAQVQDHEISIDNALKRADRALYSAKNGGRDCVRAWKSNLYLASDSDQRVA